MQNSPSSLQGSVPPQLTRGASTSSPRRVAVAGASGRMGHALVEALQTAQDLVLVAALDTPHSPAVGTCSTAFLGNTEGPTISSEIANTLQSSQAQVLIDFTRPQGTLAHLAVCQSLGIQMVIGTTGFTSEEKANIQKAAQHMGIVMAPNMSMGVASVLQLLAVAAGLLPPAHYDTEIVEMHHRHKVDAPSGTALQMGQVVAQASGRALEDCAVYARHGHTGERAAGSIGFSTLRGGDVVGDHTVIFAGLGERIEISHKSSGRMPYALGSLQAARFLATQNHGLFSMGDVLGLSSST
jgi:4-hydroxy-tetrahydrodipicolinate reductase